MLCEISHTQKDNFHSRVSLRFLGRSIKPFLYMQGEKTGEAGTKRESIERGGKEKVCGGEYNQSTINTSNTLNTGCCESQSKVQWVYSINKCKLKILIYFFIIRKRDSEELIRQWSKKSSICRLVFTVIGGNPTS